MLSVGAAIGSLPLHSKDLDTSLAHVCGLTCVLSLTLGKLHLEILCSDPGVGTNTSHFSLTGGLKMMEMFCALGQR